jgi:hypothetical protein
MYDQINLSVKLKTAGYSQVSVQDYQSSGIASWNDYGLDFNGDGSQYKPGSLYLEATK